MIVNSSPYLKLNLCYCLWSDKSLTKGHFTKDYSSWTVLLNKAYGLWMTTILILIKMFTVSELLHIMCSPRDFSKKGCETTDSFLFSSLLKLTIIWYSTKFFQWDTKIISQWCCRLSFQRIWNNAREDRITVNLKTTRESTFTQTFTAGGVHSFLENCSIGGRSNVSHFIMYEKN